MDFSAIHKAYRDSITKLSNSAVHRKNVGDGMLAGDCYICMRGWQIGEEEATLRCECPSWTHEACLAKSAFQTGGNCIQKPNLLILPTSSSLFSGACLSGRADPSILYRSISTTVEMNRPSHTRSPSPSFYDRVRGYIPPIQQSYNNLLASMQPMAISDHGTFGDPAEEYVFVDPPFMSSLPHGLTSTYPQQPDGTVFAELNPPRQVSEYVLPQNCDSYSMDADPSNLTPASESVPFPAASQSPFSLSSQQFYPPHGAYNDPVHGEVVDSLVHWRPGLDELSIPSHHAVGSMIRPGELPDTYGLEDTLDTEEWLSSMPSSGLGFTDVDAGLNYDSGGGLLGSSSADDESSRATSSQEKRPRIITTREDGNYECTVEGCGKLFNRSYNYRAHIETHDSERFLPFICELPGCMKRFRRKTDLQRHHQSVHIKQKNHQCEYCGRFFSRKDSLGR